MRVRYYGHVGAPTGYGDAANELCMAMLAADIEIDILTTGTEIPFRYQNLSTRIVNEDTPTPEPDAVIIHTLPLDCGRALSAAQVRERFPKARCIAYTTWEGQSKASPEVLVALAPFDEVWLPSTQTRDCFGRFRTHRGLFTPLTVIPHAFDESLWRPDVRSPPPVGPYRFYYVGAWTRRKNVDGLIHAYVRAFTSRADVMLTIQSAGAARSAAEIALLSTGVLMDAAPRVEYRPQRCDNIAELHASSHCFVTATRGEAWNLPAFDALLHGNHIIAPCFTGSDDFLIGSTADLYTSRNVPAGGEVVLMGSDPDNPAFSRARYIGSQGLTVRDEWLDPDLTKLAEVMRRAYDHRTIGLQVDYDPRKRFGRRAVGKLIRDTLERTPDA